MSSGLATSEPLALTLPQYRQQPQLATGFKGQFKAKENVEMTLPRRRTKYPKAPWHIVWCHEHCHKVAMAEVAQQLRETAKTLGAGMVFLKKTKDYMTFLASHSSVPHVLVTNWREVKPTMEEMGKEEHSNPPFGVMVLADKGTVFRRATEWATSCRDTRVSVLVDSAFGELNALLADYADKVFGKHSVVQEANKAKEKSRVAVQDKSRVAVQAGNLQAPSKHDLSALPPNANPRCTDMPFAQKEGELRIVKPSPVVQQHPGMIVKPSPVVQQHPGMLAFLMEAVKNQQCAAKIQQDLLQSLPEVYED